MNEQIENVIVEQTDDVLVATEDVATAAGKSSLKKVGIGLGIMGLVAGVAALVKKNKHRIHESMARKLERNGYVVHKATSEVVRDESMENEDDSFPVLNED